MSTIYYTSFMRWKNEKPFLTATCDELCSRIANKETTFEVLKSSMRRLYFDIDCYTDKIKKQDAEIIEKWGAEYIKRELCKLYDESEFSIVIGTSHGKTNEGKNKYSVRYWIPEIKGNKDTILKLVNFLNDNIRATYQKVDDHLFDYVGELFEDASGNYSKNVFDNGIYNNDRKMRCVNSSKPDETRPLILKNGNIIDTIITASELAQISLIDKTPINTKNGKSNANNYIEKYIDYASLINKSEFSEYMTWFKFQRASANLLIPFHVYDDIVRDTEGYDETKNKETYEQPNNDNKGKLGWKTIFDLAYKSNPTQKSELDIKWGTDLFCYHQFKKICSKYDPTSDEKTQDEIFIKAKTYFEKYHFKVNNPYCFGRKSVDGYEFISRESLHNIYENLYIRSDKGKAKKSFTHMWIVCENIRVYEDYDFCPPPINIDCHTFNLFNGFVYEKFDNIELTNEEIMEESRIFIKHIWYLSGKNNDVTEYLLNYFAHMLQYAGELPRTAILLKSEQGVGKSLFLEMFGEKILGERYILPTAELDHLIGRFPLISQKIMCVMDETNGKDSFAGNDKIKNIITAKTLYCEKKGIDAQQIRNCNRMFFLSNNENPIKIEQSDRRFVVAECSSDIKNDIVYFKALISAFNDKKKLIAFTQFLLSRDITEWDSTNDRPITNAYREIQSATVPVENRFFALYDEFDYEDSYSGKDLYQMYGRFCINQIKPYKPIAELSFLKKLKTFDFLNKWKSNGLYKYKIEQESHIKFINSIQTCNCEDTENEDAFEY